MREQTEILNEVITDAELDEVSGGNWWSGTIDRKAVQDSLVHLDIVPRWTWDTLRVS